MDGSISLRSAERKRLLEHYRKDPGPAVRLRAHIILLLADGCPWALIAAMLYCSTRTISRWKQRFEVGGVEATHLESLLPPADRPGTAIQHGRDQRPRAAVGQQQNDVGPQPHRRARILPVMLQQPLAFCAPQRDTAVHGLASRSPESLPTPQQQLFWAKPLSFSRAPI